MASQAHHSLQKNISSAVIDLHIIINWYQYAFNLVYQKCLGMVRLLKKNQVNEVDLIITDTYYYKRIDI